MRVLVCGGRKFFNKVLFRGEMNMLHADINITLIIHGGANGADWLAKYWAASVGIPSEQYKADWAGQGRSAGPRRNAIMLRESRPDLVVAFPGGSGTADMVKKAKKAGVKVKEIKGEYNAK